jgi:hypothetical protein
MLLRFVVSNDVFKLKEYNLDSKQCRRTSLAPRFGNPPTTMLLIPPPPSSAAAEVAAPPPAEENFVFSTGARVVGVSSFPLTGDPSQVRIAPIIPVSLLC